MNDLVNRILIKLANKKVPITFPPVAEKTLVEVENRLGFSIPPLLRLIYTNIANGGFGPGYGIIGVTGGYASDLGTLVETYTEIIRGRQSKWKPGLLPFCEWGCNIFSCVDCNAPHYPIFQSEECEADAQNYSLEDFFNMWLDDVDIWGASNSPPNNSPQRTVEIINPFTRKKMSVTVANRPKKSGDEASKSK